MTKKHRPFEITPELEEDSQRLIEEYVTALKSGSDRLDSIEALTQLFRDERERQESLYQPSPPNSTCNHAICMGVLIENAMREYKRDTKGELLHTATHYTNRCYPLGTTHLLEIPFEKAFIWTYDVNSNTSSLLVEVDSKVKQEKWWKTLASCLRIAFALNSNFERLPETGYNWIHYFDPSKKLDNQKFIYDDRIITGTFNGYIETPDDVAEIAPVIDLLIRDDVFFTAAQNLLTSFENHSFCVICAFRPREYQDHPNHEPEIWEVAPLIPKMEVAIVQATRACEGILGKPGKNQERALSRWRSKITLNPHDSFDLVGKTYFDFYLDLFDIRGDAAHNLGSFPYELSREITIQSQIFAWQVLKNYYDSHHMSHKEALTNIKFNQDILSIAFKEKML